MTELEKQMEFSEMLSEFIPRLVDLGYKVTLGEAWRSEETCKIYVQQGKGTKNSNHMKRLAIDLNLFKDGVWLNRTESYKEAGEIWESMSTKDVKCCWGGRFLSRPDGNHFSIEHDGVR